MGNQDEKELRYRGNELRAAYDIKVGHGREEEGTRIDHLFELRPPF